jgi:PAS domain S-box-containing protein
MDALISRPDAGPESLRDGSKLSAMIREYDWSGTSLGPLEDWPQVVKTTVALILRSPVPIVTLWGEKGVMVYNDAYADFAGGRHPEILGMDVLEAWPEAAEWNRKVMDTVFHRGESLSVRDLELTLVRHGVGEPAWMNLDYSPVPDEAGHPAGVIAVVVETTAVIRAERQIRGERERLRQMFDQAPGFMALLEGANHVITMANQAYSDLVGGREIIGKTVADALPEAVEQHFIDLLNRVYQSRQPYVGHAIPVRLRRDGYEEERFVDFVYQPLIAEGGELTGIFVQGHDVTEHKRSEQLRIAHNRVLELAIQDAPLEETLEGLVRTVEESSTSGMLGSILLVDEGGLHLRHGAAPSLPPSYNATIDGLEIGPGAGSCGTAAFTKTPVFVSDIAADPLWSEFRDLAAEHGLAACWSIPILSGSGDVLGTFAMYHREPREPTGQDLELVQVITRTAALIINRKRVETALRESEQRFRLVAERAPVMLWMGDPTGKCLYLNKAQRDFWGLSEDQVAGFEWGSSLHPDDRSKLADSFTGAMANHTPFTLEARYKRADGLYRRVHTHAEPRFDSGGRFLGMIGVNVDVTDQREAEERYRRIFEQTSDLILTADLDQVITDCNPAAAEAVGLTREQAIGRRISEFISAEDYARSSGMLQAKLDRGGTTKYDVRVKSSSGELLFWEINSGLTFDDVGNPVGLHVVARDVTERKRFERHQQLLVGELNHRVKNSLAIVQSLAHQSFQGSFAPEDAIGRFQGRLQALAGAHNLLTLKNWDAASIKDVVDDALLPFCSHNRCRIEGPEVPIPPQTAVSLALALHELATNASKYGALSNDSGSICVSWTVEDDQLDFRWTERGGPPVVQPERRGFGTRMIERTLASEFGGTVDLDFASEGLTCRVLARIPSRKA